MGLLKLVVLCAAIAAISSESIDSDVSSRILGGVNTRFAEFPHICSVNLVIPVLPGVHVGSANVLNNRWVLTVASVVERPPLFTFYEVVCGRSNLGLSFEPFEQRVRIQNIYPHPLFFGVVPSPNDIALIHLGVQLNFNDAVQPINLPIANAVPTGIASLIGWGGTDEAWIGQRFGVLQLSRVAILPVATCTPLVQQWLFNSVNHFCTGPLTGGMSPCNDDLGSSLLTRVNAVSTLIGMVSLPQGCGTPGAAGTYIRVSAFNAWITSTMF